MTVINRFFVTGMALAVFLISDQAMAQNNEATAKKGGMNARRAIVVLSPSVDSKVTGVVYFTETDQGVKVSGTVENLTPGKHGFHVHEFGDCSGEGSKTAGGHFNPTNKKHGGRLDAERHVGDLGNIEAGADGKAAIDFVDTVITLHGPDSIIGRAIIVHAGADDLVSQPAGDAGARVACGTIGLAKDEGIGIK